MFLKVEGDFLVNVELIDRVEFHQRHGRKLATAYSGGIVLHAESEILYKFFSEPNSSIKVL